MKNDKWKVSERTRMRGKACLLALFLILGSLTGVTASAAEDAESKVGSLYALSAVLMDGETGRVLLGKEEDVARPMASTTKILTCIIALENGNLDDVVTVSKEAQSQPKVHAGLQENEMYFLEDLLHSLMLESHNDSAVAIAEHLGGSVEGFAEIMNKKAKEIGCENANFVTPNGLDEENENGKHSISASDLALIMRYCVTQSPKAEKFIEITQTRSYQFQEITGKRTVSCTNYNAFLDMMDGVISGKTGFTGEAGYCYVCAVEQKGKTLIVALLGCGWPSNKTYKWSDTKKLLTYGMENYEYEDIPNIASTPEIPVENGIPQNEELLSESMVKTEMAKEEQQILKSADEKITAKMEYQKSLTAPVEEGTVIGRVTYFIGDDQIMEQEIKTADSVKKRNLKWYLEKLSEKYIEFKIF